MELRIGKLLRNSSGGADRVAGRFEAIVDVASFEFPLSVGCQLYHLHALLGQGVGRFRFEGCLESGDKKDAVELELLAGVHRNDEMSVVDGIKAAPDYSDLLSHGGSSRRSGECVKIRLEMDLGLVVPSAKGREAPAVFSKPSFPVEKPVV